ncbi:MAG: porin family protein [Bacteroidales bacterium]|nr:porin family protein [Bacteroidales bacterium]
MKINRTFLKIIPAALLFCLPLQKADAQGFSFRLYAEPLISWFSSDTEATMNDGARPGFAYGLTFDTYFTPNYAFSTGIGLMNTSGRLNYSDTITINFKNSVSPLYPGENILYKIQYLTVPLAINMKSNQIGYMTFFANVGMKPKIVISGKGSIPAHAIEKENVMDELKLFNLGYQITLGTEYSLGGSTAIILGLGYEDNFLDITKDNEGQPDDKIRQYIIRFKLGLNF